MLGGLIASEFAKAWKADDIDKKTMAKNSKAFGKQAEARERVRIHENNLFEKMKINATRKKAILQCHIQKFINVYKVIDEYQLNRGLGIKEMEKIESLKNKMVQTVNMPQIAVGIQKSDVQTVCQWAIYGIGGLILKESEENSKLASRNMANANVVSAQADSICIFYDGLAERVQICTDILQKLAAKDMLAINHIESLLKHNGKNEELYTQDDIDAINLCSELNILMYEIINTPLLDENNEITQASKRIIEKGQQYIQMLG